MKNVLRWAARWCIEKHCEGRRGNATCALAPPIFEQQLPSCGLNEHGWITVDCLVLKIDLYLDALAYGGEVVFLKSFFGIS